MASILLFAAAALSIAHGWKVCDVTRYGAVGDNKTSCTSAFRSAAAACVGGKSSKQKLDFISRILFFNKLLSFLTAVFHRSSR